MKTKLNLLVAVSALGLMVGCARFSTKQTDTRYGEDGKPATSITTKATAYTLISSSSSLANFKATQTEKSQSANVGSLTQEAHADTNYTSMIEAVVKAAVTAAAGVAK